METKTVAQPPSGEHGPPGWYLLNCASHRSAAVFCRPGEEESRLVFAGGSPIRLGSYFCLDLIRLNSYPPRRYPASVYLRGDL